MKKEKRKISRFIYWTPRIISIIFIAFLSLFSLDIFGNGYTFWETIIGLFMHNIPSLFLFVVLIISWRYELIGAVVFILFGLWYFLTVAINQNILLALSWSVQIALPAFLVGILFFLGWKKKQAT